MDALHALFVSRRAQKIDEEHEAEHEQNGGHDDQKLPVFQKQIRVIRLLIDGVLRRELGTDIACDGHMRVVKALVGNIRVYLAGLVLRAGCVVGHGDGLGGFGGCFGFGV